jgi:hypothetical protein
MNVVLIPKGRLKSHDLSAVPSGLILLRAPVPNVENVGLLSGVPPGQELDAVENQQILVALDGNVRAPPHYHRGLAKW